MTLQISRPLRIARNLILVAILLLLLALAAAWIAMRMSLPALAGDRSLAGVKSAVSVSRDTRGTVTIAAADMADAVRALGFVHGQERFFEMDLTRRSAARELDYVACRRARAPARSSRGAGGWSASSRCAPPPRPWPPSCRPDP